MPPVYVVVTRPTGYCDYVTLKPKYFGMLIIVLHTCVKAVFLSNISSATFASKIMQLIVIKHFNGCPALLITEYFGECGNSFILFILYIVLWVNHLLVNRFCCLLWIKFVIYCYTLEFKLVI